MTTNSIERSIKDKVKKTAVEQNRQFSVVWLVVILERWLVRLHSSKHRDLFIFKGGMCLNQYLSIGRDTKDLDFLIKGIKSNRENIEKIFEEVNQIDVNDGVKFTSLSVNNLAHAHKKYPGFEINMRAELGQTRTPIRIDIGIGDIVKPENITIQLSETKGTPLFEKEIELWAYSPEQIFAEKFQTAVWRGVENSRMKDYHDLVLLIDSQLMDEAKLKKAIETTFKNRSTALSLIPNFQPSEMAQFNQRWSNHLKTSKSEGLVPAKLPKNFEEVHKLINSWVNKLSLKF